MTVDNDSQSHPSTNPDHPAPADATLLADRIVESGVAAFEMYSIYLGDQLGWYRFLADNGPSTAAELAEQTGTVERYAREWLEQQAVAGFVQVEQSGTDDRFWLSEAAIEVFTDIKSLSYLAPLAKFVGAVGKQLPGLAGAYAAGGGVSWAGFGPDARTAQADMNRPWFERELPGVLAGQPDLHERLSRPGARIADVGCGAGWSSIALATAYPAATVIGFDIDEPSIRLAQENAQHSPAAGRIEFTFADAAELPESGPFDVVFAFECVHDMPDPVGVIAKSKEAVRPGGVMVIMDEATADSFAPNGDLVERLLYGWSITICLPDSLSHPGSIGTGTVMRAETLRKYATAAGFDHVEILPTGEFGLWRFYQLS